MGWRRARRMQELMAVLTLAGASALLTSTIVLAQSSCTISEGCLLREGTPIPLKFAADLSSGSANQGDDVEFVLADDLKVADSIVVPKGARAVGTVAYVKRAGMMEKPGELGVRLQYLIAGSDRVRIRVTEQRESDSEMWSERGSESHGHSPFGGVKHGKNVEKPAGAPLTAYVNEDIWLVPVR